MEACARRLGLQRGNSVGRAVFLSKVPTSMLLVTLLVGGCVTSGAVLKAFHHLLSEATRISTQDPCSTLPATRRISGTAQQRLPTNSACRIKSGPQHT